MVCVFLLTMQRYNNYIYLQAKQAKKQKFIDKIVTEIMDESGITPSLAEDVVTENTWTVDKIKNRTNKIVATLMDMYKW